MAIPVYFSQTNRKEDDGKIIIVHGVSVISTTAPMEADLSYDRFNDKGNTTQLRFIVRKGYRRFKSIGAAHKAWLKLV